ncbi:DUF4168 domain-containing protein [Christiangramia sabulilitoris]|uniref:DUF4168 domain-containing protein n=1 Tax=Christiangramia sabulilitoris TaxID=2583991 RepID=A0A550I2P9_9FLAO|nr:DUF4168 domain-containing protein [Christiangramia sabulilitoris]TRO65262.1 DUF4168 domain-containing protein [Christiangramia sabulilitoris]
MKKLFSSLLFVIALGTASISAQNTPMPQEQQQIEVSDAELTEFAEVFQKMRMMNQQVQQEMIAVVEERDLEIERFNEIHQAKMEDSKAINTTTEEEKKYQKVIAEIEEIQPVIQKKMQEVIEDSDLSMERYQQVAMALRSNTDLQLRLQEIMKS